MKNIKILSVLIIILTALFFGGCYTQIAMNDNGDNYGNDNYGYNNDQNSQDYQTPADSAYGDQYDSLSQIEPTTINNYYFGYPRYWGSMYYGYSPSYSFGVTWGFPYYNPYYWDPFGIWNYYPTYYNPYSYYGGYYNPYYYGNYGYYGYYGSYYSKIANRSRETNRLRNNDGFRNNGDRGNTFVGNNDATTIPTVSTNRNEPISRPVTTNSGRSGSVNSTNNRGSQRVEGRPVESGRNNSGRTISRQTYQVRKIEYYRNTNRESNRTYSPNNSETNRNNSNRSYNNQRNAGRYEAPRSYSPPQRSYSPPPTRSYSPPSARSSSSNSSRGSSERRGR